MIRVTVWYEYVQEAEKIPEEFLPAGISEEKKAEMQQGRNPD